MSGLRPFTCALVGGDTLLVACAEVVVARGGSIRAVLSRAPVVREWARKQGIPVFEPTRAVTRDLACIEFEHLFSIAHLSIVPDEILALARGERINFHDAPLPRLAGLNTPNWAILRGEREHGVTWHRMTSGVDEGEILATETFSIEADETALSLNTKCFEAGVRSFGALLDDLVGGRLAPKMQDLSTRRYYSRADRPPALGLVDWSRTAEEIERLVRALDAGRYKNPFGSAIACAGSAAWIVKRVRARGDTSSSPPGALVGGSEHELFVSTGSGVIAVQECATLSGVDVPLAEVRGALVAAGGRFDVFGADTRAALDRTAPQIGRDEDFWVSRLTTSTPLEVPFLVPPTGGARRIERLDLGSASTLLGRHAGHPPHAVLAAVVTAWVARLAGRTEFDVAWSTTALRERCRGLERWLSPRVLLRVRTSIDAPFSQWVESMAREVEVVGKRGTFAHDAIGRDPALAGQLRWSAGFALPTAIECVEGSEDVTISTTADAAFVLASDGRCALVHDASRLAADAARSLRDSFEAFVADLSRGTDPSVARVDLVGQIGRERATTRFHEAERVVSDRESIQAAIAATACRTPDAPAVSCGTRTISYREVVERARRLARHLRSHGAGPDAFVGICLERSVDLVVAVLAVLETGAAYLPLDPAFPEERTRFMLHDSGARIAIAQAGTEARVASSGATIVRIDADSAAIERLAGTPLESSTTPTDLAYVIYTSGSTGKPKGVLVEHGNVLNFFTGMDAALPHASPGTWLAVTSLSFDISVLELLWTLARGFHLVVHSGRGAAQPAPAARSTKPVEFSLFYFASDETKQGAEKYRLLLDGARFADEHGFAAVWTPERHFHAFGGMYPAPAVTAAALATITKRVSIRAGSVVLPLNDPIRVAEAWSVVDNLSNGRVGISFASGWQPNDFVLAPLNFARAKHVMFESLDVVRKLWRGESVSFPGPKGELVAVRTLPRPVQAELPTWITTAGNPETYAQAGRAGANLLTHLLGQSVEELAPKIEIYRRARAEAGFDPSTGSVTLMLHTFVAEAGTDVRGIVRGPLRNYLGTSLDLLKKYAWAFPAFKKPAAHDASGGDEFAGLSDEERDAVLEHAFERYFETSGLFGTPEQCVARVDELRAIGVDEIACLIDFGVPVDAALAALPALHRLSASVRRTIEDARATVEQQGGSVADDILRHRVTHMQCTPSMARMLCLDPPSRAALWTVSNLMIGGEAFPSSLSSELASFPGTITNMYGPTETTIWSSTHVIAKGTPTIPIGTPIANTEFHVLDTNRERLPDGVPGELWIGGLGVARGYHARPELTNERFVADPYSPRSGSRMYRTGDLVRRRPDGVVEFLGRIDHQVKIRGYRIELGEIESALAAHTGVREAVVVAGVDAHGEARLVAYWVPGPSAPTPDVLRDALRAKLPEYMVPGWFVALDAFPLTPNGKIDRKALPAPESGPAPEKRARFVAPENEIESKLAALWHEVLGVKSVGVDDNFFDVGGHSLLVVRLHRKLPAIVDRPVSLTDLYRFPTIRSFAAWVAMDGANKTLDVGAERGARRRDALLRRRRE